MEGLLPAFDLRLTALLAVAVVAGLVRGMSGFGAAMIYVPVASLLSGPQTAIVSVLLIDGLATLPLTWQARRLWRWREVLPLAIGAMLFVPVGAQLLVHADPETVRWAASLLILGLIGAVAAGWRYERPLPVPVTAAVGGASGLMGGLTGLAGPPVVLFCLGGKTPIMVLRANLFVFFTLIGLATAASYVATGLYTAPRLALGLLLLPLFGAGLVGGAKLARRIPERVFRAVALSLCALAAALGLPLFG